MDGCGESHTSNASSVWGIELQSTTHTQCCIKGMKHQPITLSWENNWNWKHVHISYSAFFDYSHVHGCKCSEIYGTVFVLFFHAWPLASHHFFWHVDVNVRYGDTLKAGIVSVCVCLWYWEGDHCQLTGPSLLSLFKGFVKAAALSHPHWQKPALSPQIKLDP